MNDTSRYSTDEIPGREARPGVPSGRTIRITRIVISLIGAAFAITALLGLWEGDLEAALTGMALTFVAALHARRSEELYRPLRGAFFDGEAFDETDLRLLFAALPVLWLYGLFEAVQWLRHALGI